MSLRVQLIPSRARRVCDREGAGGPRLWNPSADQLSVNYTLRSVCSREQTSQSSGWMVGGRLAFAHPYQFLLTAKLIRIRRWPRYSLQSGAPAAKFGWRRMLRLRRVLLCSFSWNYLRRNAETRSMIPHQDSLTADQFFSERALEFHCAVDNTKNYPFCKWLGEMVPRQWRYHRKSECSVSFR